MEDIFELYDLDNDIEEKNNVAVNYPEIVAQMEKFASKAHENNIIGSWLDKSKQFKGHLEK